MEVEYLIYRGKSTDIGEKIWYDELEIKKSDLKAQGIKIDLAHILLTGRKTDILIIVMENGKPIANGWGRLLKKYTHLDRIFVFPDFRGRDIAKNIVKYFIFLRRGIIWNAVHDAMDYIAKDFNGFEGTVDGYRGWILLDTKYPGNLELELPLNNFYNYCENCHGKSTNSIKCDKCGYEYEDSRKNTKFMLEDIKQYSKF